MDAVEGSALSRRQTSKPVRSGRLTSRMTRSGLAAASRSASAPLAASRTSKPSLRKIQLSSTPVGVVVFHEQNGGVLRGHKENTRPADAEFPVRAGGRRKPGAAGSGGEAGWNATANMESPSGGRGRRRPRPGALTILVYGRTEANGAAFRRRARQNRARISADIAKFQPRRECAAAVGPVAPLPAAGTSVRVHRDAGVAKSADASDLNYLSTGAGNPPREFSRSRGNRSTSEDGGGNPEPSSGPPGGEGVETWRLRPTAVRHGQGKVQTTNRTGGESRSGTKIRRGESPVRVRVPPPALGGGKTYRLPLNSPQTCL